MSEQQGDAGRLPVGSVGTSPPTDPHSQPNTEVRAAILHELERGVGAVPVTIDKLADRIARVLEPMRLFGPPATETERRLAECEVDLESALLREGALQAERQKLAAEIREFIENETEIVAAMLGQGDYPLIAALLRETGR